MSEITMSGVGLCAVSFVWFLIGACVGAWAQERRGSDDANDGNGEDGGK